MVFAQSQYFHSLHRSQKPETPKGQARTDEPDATPLRGVRAGKSFYCLSFCVHSFTYQVYSPQFHLYLVKCLGGQNVSSSRFSFFVCNLLALTHQQSRSLSSGRQVERSMPLRRTRHQDFLREHTVPVNLPEKGNPLIVDGVRYSVNSA